MNARIAVPAAIATIAAVAFLAQPGDLPVPFWLAVKAVPVLCGAAIAFQQPTRLAKLVGVGLLFSAVGDVVLEVPADLFVPGLLAFLVAHVFYVLAWVQDERALRPLVAVPFYAYGLGMLVFLKDGMGPLLVPVAVYVGVICTMLWRGWARVRPGADATVWAGAVGVIVFAASDSTIAVNKFHAPVPHEHLVVMVTYWLGQAGIVAATLTGGEARPSR